MSHLVNVCSIERNEEKEEAAGINLPNKNAESKKSNSYVLVIGFTLPVVVDLLLPSGEAHILPLCVCFFKVNFHGNV